MGKYENASGFAYTDRRHPMLSGSRPLIPSVIIRVQLTIAGHGEVAGVKWGHSPFFANKSLQDGDRDAQMVPNDLARRAASKYVQLHIDLLGS